MTVVTVRGAHGQAAQSINFTENSDALYYGQMLAAMINGNRTASETVIAAAGNYSVNSALVVLKNSGQTTVYGMGDESIIGGSGGVTFEAAQNAVDLMVLAGGNNNLIFAAGSRAEVATGDGSDYIIAEGNASIDAGGGKNTIVAAQAAGTTTDIYSTGSDEIFLGAGAASVAFASNEATAVGGSGNAIFADYGAKNVIYLGTGADSVFTAGSNSNVLGGQGSQTIFDGGKNNLFVLGAGNANVTLAGSDALVFGGVGAATIRDEGAFSTIIGGAGAATVFGGAGTLDFFGTGSSLFVGGTGAKSSDTLIGGTGGATVFGGTSDVVFVGQGGLSFIGHGGGSSTVVANSGGNATMFGAVKGTVQYDGAMGTTDYFVAGSGNTTLVSSTNAGGLNIFTGNGADFLSGGYSNQFFVQTGNATMAGGAGSDVYDFTNGLAGGKEKIINFGANDQIDLSGYGANGVASQNAVGGNYVVTLTDNTTITLLGVTGLSSNQLHSS